MNFIAAFIIGAFFALDICNAGLITSKSIRVVSFSITFDLFFVFQPLCDIGGTTGPFNKGIDAVSKDARELAVKQIQQRNAKNGTFLNFKF